MGYSAKNIRMHLGSDGAHIDEIVESWEPAFYIMLANNGYLEHHYWLLKQLYDEDGVFFLARFLRYSDAGLLEGELYKINATSMPKAFNHMRRKMNSYYQSRLPRKAAQDMSKSVSEAYDP
jgi:hypothetical protein